MIEIRLHGRGGQGAVTSAELLATVNANQIALEELGLPITNTTMLGALLKAREIFQPGALIDPLGHCFGRVAEKIMMC